MFRIKICGVSTAKDAQLVALAGADAIGLNFYAASPRYLDPDRAEAVARAIPARVARIGVFVNSPAAEVAALAERLGLDWIQLHGDEPPEYLAALSGHAILRSFRFDGNLVSHVREYLRSCQSHGVLPSAILIDTGRTDEYGGTGESFDWGAMATMRNELRTCPLVLAGGLSPFNVAEAVARVRPDAVDVASGVESKPGVKDMLLLRAFISAAKKALADVVS